MSAAETWTPSPARGYKWPDATPGNFIALKHGARSRRIYEPIAADLAAGLLEERPDLEDYPDALTQWAEAEARAELLRKWVAEQGIFDGDQAPRSGVLTWLRVFENQAAEARKVLGLDPRSHAELVRVRAEATAQMSDLDALLARGREARLEAEKRLGLGEAEPDSAGGRVLPPTPSPPPPLSSREHEPPTERTTAVTTGCGRLLPGGQGGDRRAGRCRRPPRRHP
jgi:hypothetical protein